MNPKSKKTSKIPTPKTKPSSKKTISAKPTKTKLVSTPKEIIKPSGIKKFPGLGINVVLKHQDENSLKTYIH